MEFSNAIKFLIIEIFSLNYPIIKSNKSFWLLTLFMKFKISSMKYLLVLISFFIGLTASAQEYEVVSFDMEKTDLTARTNPRIDSNGRKCAVIKIYADDRIAAVRGAAIGEVAGAGMEKLVYMAHDSKAVELAFDHHLPLKIVFEDFGYPTITGQMTYVCKLQSKGNLTQTHQAQGDVNSIPEHQSQKQRQDNNASSGLGNGNVNFRSKVYDKVFEKGAKYYNSKNYYPKAYESFMKAGDDGDTNGASRATAYFNAGLAAYMGNHIEKSANAFKRAIEFDYDSPEAWIYNIACWQNIVENNPSQTYEAEKMILETALSGYYKFGINQPLFINNVINCYVKKNDYVKALELLDSEIFTSSQNPRLYGLRGFVYDRMGNDDLSVKDYLKASSLSDADFGILLNAAKKLYSVGADKYNNIIGDSSEAYSERQNIRKIYIENALDIANKAKRMDPYNSDLENVIKTIKYSLKQL